MGFLQEAINDFYKQQTFYSSAKSYKPELRKQIIDFFRRKGIDGYKDDYDFYPNFDYNKTKQVQAKDRRKEFHKIHDKIEIKDKFFSANSGYDARITFPKMFMGDMRWELEISSNESFFEHGHDVKIRVKNTSNPEKPTRDFTYKVNLMRPVPQVLEDLWKDIEKSLADFEETEKPEQPQAQQRSKKRYVKSDIQRIVSLYLEKQYKTYKSGKKVEIDDYEKKPVHFYVQMQGKSDKTFSSHGGRGQEGFTLNLEVRKLQKNTTKSGSSWRSTEKLKPELAARFPGYEKWADILTEGHKEVRGNTRRYNETWLFGERSYGEEHIKLWDRLQLATRKFIKLGYFPNSYRTPYKQGESAKIEFKKDPNLARRVEEDPSIIDRIMRNQKYGANLRRAFFYKGDDPNRVYEKCLKEVFENWK